MTKKTWAYSDDLDATEFNRIQEQLWTVCTSEDRPDHVDGRFIYEVDTKRTYHSDGSSWVGRTDDEWTYFVPSFSNVTLGTGNWGNAAYRYYHGDMIVYGFRVMGTSPAFGSDMRITVPNSETISSTHRIGIIPFGQCSITAAGALSGVYWSGMLEYASSTTLSFWWPHIDTTTSVATQQVDASVTTSTFPQTAAVGDTISFNFYIPLT
jgi:hypothetical protein